jgi:hypothetical protein
MIQGENVHWYCDKACQFKTFKIHRVVNKFSELRIFIHREKNFIIFLH